METKKYEDDSNQTELSDLYCHYELKSMLLDFLKDCRKKQLLTGNPTLREMLDFITNWIDINFPNKDENK